ncbi:outer membrane pore E domain protein [Shigella flexneri 1235-66]|nr:outer membrane pore E domain protein [Shigella flexneri 1235-66]
MKKSTLALAVMGIVASASVQAAEVYNKNGNKLDLYGKVKAMHYMTDYDSKDGDQSYIRLGFKGETQINDELTGYGRWEAEFAGNKAESDSNQQKTRLAFAGLKLKILAHLIMVVTWVRCTMWKRGPICSRNSAATPQRKPITL